MALSIPKLLQKSHIWRGTYDENDFIAFALGTITVATTDKLTQIYNPGVGKKIYQGIERLFERNQEGRGE